MKKKSILITSLGNALEWFDFGLFIFLAPIMGEKFFPTHDPIKATIAAFIVFAAGFICRPIGGIIFGHAGDTHGRAKTLRVSVLIITISTFLVGLLPTYDKIGFAAPLLFTLLRLVQGIAIGGEYSGVMVYLAESAPTEKRGLITSFAATGANIGFLGATFMLILLTINFSQTAITDWAWRLPFICVGFLGSVILYFRFNLKETPTFAFMKTAQQIKIRPLLTALKHAPNSLLKIFGMTCMSAALYYVFFEFMLTYVKNHLGVTNQTALYLQAAFLVLMLILVPLAGILGDRYGRKSILMLTSSALLIFAIPSFYLLQTHLLFDIIAIAIVATVLSSLDQGNILTAAVENCPANVRYSGVAFSYNLGMAIFGGTAPLIVTILTQKVSFMAPAYYLMLMATITLISAATLLRKVDRMEFMVES